jgi:hypothetical protein
VKRLTSTVVVAIALSACSTSNVLPPTNSASTLPASTVTTAAPTTTATTTTAPSHTPVWLTVKYRSDLVDVADPRFAYLDGGSSSLVDAAFYDASNVYMIISLNGTAYHYCGMPDGVWGEFTAAESLGSFYKEQIKGRFDCRSGVVPEY